MTSEELIATVKKQPIGFACGGLCVICAGLIYFSSSQIEGREAEYETKSAEAAKILDNVRNSAKLPEQVVEIQALAKEMDSRLIRAGQLAVNQQYFYKLEAETEVKMSEVRQSTPPRSLKATSQLYPPIPFNVSVQGSYKQVLDFLQRLETGPHFCRFTTITFAKADSNPGSTNMTLNLNLELLGTQ